MTQVVMISDRLRFVGFTGREAAHAPTRLALTRWLLTSRISHLTTMSSNISLRSLLVVLLPVSLAVGSLYLSAEHASMPPVPPPGPEGIYPGDTVIPNAVMVYDQTKLINAPPSDVWPWVQQVGKGRGGKRARWRI